MAKVVKSCNEGSRERWGVLRMLLQVEEIILGQGSLWLIPPEGPGMDTMTLGSPSDLESRPSQPQANHGC